MTAIGFASIAGAPGVTTWSILVSSAVQASISNPEGNGDRSPITDSVLIEADPTGSKAALQYGITEGSFVHYAADPSPTPDWRRHTKSLPSGENIISINGFGKTATNLIGSSAGRLFSLLSDENEVMGIIDLGRLHLDSPVLPALNSLDSLIVLIGRTNSEIVFSSQNMKELIDSYGSDLEVGWGVVGKHGQTNEAIAKYSGIDVLVEIPDDPTGANSLFDKPSKWALQRSALSKAAYSFAQHIVANQVKPAEVLS